MTQVVIESYWGLGPIVVEGRVSPDHFVVDKATKSVLAHTSRSGSLAEEQLQALVTLLLDVERNYERPIDMEWAIKGDELFILQVRSITGL